MTTDTKRAHLRINGEMRSVAANVRLFALRFMELQIVMGLGALLCLLLGRLIPGSSTVATVYYPGSYLYAAGDVFFLTVPVVAWMNFRCHEWRRSIGLAVAMVAPVTVIALVGELAGYVYLPWLIIAGYPAMSLGMVVYMLFRLPEAERVRPART
jgi:hypothetical protein